MKEIFKNFTRTQIRSVVTILDTLAAWGLVYWIVIRGITSQGHEIAIQVIVMVLAGTLILNRQWLFGAAKDTDNKNKKEE